MTDGLTLKILGEMVYLGIALCAGYGIWELYRQYRQTTSTAFKTHITVYELRKMVEGRSR